MNKKQIKNLLSAPKNKFFNFGVVENDAVDLIIYGIIGWEVDADDLVSQLKAVTARTINVSINSVGGDVFDGTAIYNALKNHPANIIVTIEGLAASAASLIAMAGDTVNIGKNAYLMIHPASVMTFGTAKELRQTADVMDKIDGSIAQTYADATGRTAPEMAALMVAETWMVGQEAVDAGFCDAVTGDDDGDDSELSATESTLNAYNHVPERLLVAARANKSTPTGPGGRKALRNVINMSATSLGEKPMNAEAFNAYAAEHPEAVAKFIDQGKKTGLAEATNAERNRAKAIAEACAGNNELAIEAIVAGMDPENAKIAATAATKAAASATATATAATAAIAAKDQEIATLKEQVAFATGGQRQIANRGEAKPDPAKKNEESEQPTDAEGVEAQAKKDWEANKDGCRDSFLDLATFTAVAKQDAGIR